MNHDLQFKLNRLRGFALQLERDPAVQAEFAELGLPKEWCIFQAERARVLADMMEQSGSVQ